MRVCIWRIYFNTILKVMSNFPLINKTPDPKTASLFFFCISPLHRGQELLQFCSSDILWAVDRDATLPSRSISGWILWSLDQLTLLFITIRQRCVCVNKRVYIKHTNIFVTHRFNAFFQILYFFPPSNR